MNLTISGIRVAYASLKAELIQKSYNNAVLSNMDNSMHRVYSF